MDQTCPSSNPIDPNSGFNSITRIFHSLRHPPIHLPPYDTPLSAADYAFSLQRNSLWSNSVALINSATAQRVLYSEFIYQTKTLATNLRSAIGLYKGDTAFLLSPNLSQVPILYFALLSIGVVISPANPISTEFEISRLIKLCKPVIAFATSLTVHKLPKLRYQNILLDSPEFDSLTTTANSCVERGEVNQGDLAAIMYSSGTTGKIKGVMLTHRNLIAITASYHSQRAEREQPAVVLSPVPYFHVIGFFYSVKSVGLNETVVVMERFGFTKMLRAVEEFRVTNLGVVPPLVVALVKNDSDGYDLRTLEGVACGGAPLGKDVIAAFTHRFPKVLVTQGYGLTETSGPVSRTIGDEEVCQRGSVGKLEGGLEAKIVDPDTDDVLPPGKQGELWIRGPPIMKGYVGDPEATSATLSKDGWLRTGDLCYIDNRGFLYIVDRLKELIKYKGYQVPPAELEQLLQSHPEILDAAVIPYPSEEAGQVPVAFVVRQPQSCIGEAEVMDFVSKQVAPYKKIRRVAFVSSIPKNAAGKILRRELREVVLPSSSSRL
ncbi:4-coumarate CoA ligase [Quillaja saponaria]|uniref:4-coumarate CoA ligase n=1 Tax=Quillaja saponaria TaxID=32244 RepID=A0AAD7PWC8_QUISA|nr:4-coumarate CoA ligase [Quillaja saponaria]